jgi:actin-related protein
MEASAIIIDHGSGWVKAGFAGDDRPRAEVPSVVGRSSSDDDVRVGDEQLASRSNLSLSYPMERGIVQSWEDIEAVWNHLFLNELHIEVAGRAVMLTEAPHGPKANRERLTQLIFETFHAGAMYIAVQAVLALYAAGLTTGVVLDAGDGVTHAVPVLEGYALPHAILRLDLAGRDLTQYLAALLAARGHAFTGDGLEVCRDIKEKLCFVALDYEAESQAAAAEKAYTLPGGEVLTLRGECFRCCEALFQPSLVREGSAGPWTSHTQQLGPLGVHQMLYQSVMKCDADQQAAMFENIVLAGGSTMFAGMAERLTRELTALVPERRIRVLAGETPRNHSVWVGGSVLASLSTFQKMWCSRLEYEEAGPSIVHRKCF